MDDWILLIDESGDAGLQRLIADAALSAGVKEVVAQDSENVGPEKCDPLIAVISPAVQRRQAIVRQAYEQWPHTQTILLAKPGDVEELRRRTMPTLALGRRCTVVEAIDETIRRELVSAARLTARRRQHRTTLDDINLQLARSALPHVSEYRRLVISDRYFATVLESATDAILSLDQHGLVRSWNLAAERLFGYPEAIVLGRSLEPLLQIKVPSLTQSSNLPGSARTEMRCRCADGQMLDVEWTFTNVLDAGQKLGAIAAIGRDITRRKRAALELSRTNEILNSILSNMGDAVVVADKDENFLVFNPAAERMFGAGATETKSHEWSQRYGIYLPDKVTLFPHDQLPLTRSIRGEEVNEIEMFVRRQNAPEGIWTRVNGRPLRGPTGELLGGIIVCRDITLAREEEFFRAGQSRVLEMIAADAPLADILANLVLLMESQAEGLRCSIMLLHRDGKHVSHCTAPNLPEAYVNAVEGAPIGPRSGSCGTSMYRRRPVVVTDVMTDPLWADYRDLARICGLRACWSTPVLSAKGDVLGSFAMHREENRGPRPEETRLTQIATHIAGIVIERQRQQEILRERDARISLAAESANLAFWILYPEENSAWMSEKGKVIYGFDPELPLTSELILSRVHPDERAAVKAAYDRACALSGTFESEHRLLLPHGKTRWIIMRGRCLKDEKGNILETIGVTLDISAQKQADLQLQNQREEMAHQNRVSLMGEMTASFAHEVNQPLTAIANKASAALHFLEHENIDIVLLQQLLQDMVADSQRAGKVVHGIRSLVRKERSVRTVLNLNAVIADTVRLVKPDVLSRESVVWTELDPQLPDVSAALVEIQQVLLNLIINALDAMEGLPPAERRVMISTRSVHGDVAEVSVRDFGTGLPSDLPDKIFDHFFTTKHNGMGMGLAIVRSIVEAHSGTIVADNAPGRGARMVIRLPAAGEKTQAKAAT
jgi:PAS domain S-box-containing protein